VSRVSSCKYQSMILTKRFFGMLRASSYRSVESMSRSVRDVTVVSFPWSWELTPTVMNFEKKFRERPSVGRLPLVPHFFRAFGFSALSAATIQMFEFFLLWRRSLAFCSRSRSNASLASTTVKVTTALTRNHRNHLHSSCRIRRLQTRKLP
jgi:hypothetical protein